MGFFLDPIDFHCMDKLNYCVKLFFKISFVFRRNEIVFRVWNIIRVNYKACWKLEIFCPVLVLIPT